jgi:hypothetical protein
MFSRVLVIASFCIVSTALAAPPTTPETVCKVHGGFWSAPSDFSRALGRAGGTCIPRHAATVPAPSVESRLTDLEWKLIAVHDRLDALEAQAAAQERPRGH